MINRVVDHVKEAFAKMPTPVVTSPGPRSFKRASTNTLRLAVANIGQPDHPEHFPLVDKTDERGIRRR